MNLEIVSDVIYHSSLALRAQLLRRCSRRAFCFAMLSGRAHRRDNVRLWVMLIGGASADAQRYNRCAESACCSALVERNCRVWHNWSNGSMGRCPKPHKGRRPLTLQGTLSLDPFGLPLLGRFSILPLPQIFLSPALPPFSPPPHILPLEGRGIFPCKKGSDAMPTPYFEVAHLTKHFSTDASTVAAIQDVSFFPCRRGSFSPSWGPAGAEKSTLFNLIAGLMQPDCGDIRLQGESMLLRPGLTGYMLQKDLLLPWRTIADNIILSKTLHGTRRQAALKSAVSDIAACGLRDLLNRRPDECSGGQRQRAALVRTLQTGKPLLLL